MGVVSLHFMQEIVTRAFGRITGWFFTILVTVLSSVGIFLGRFYRWNSWDIFGDPLPIAHDIWGWLRHPFANLRVYGFTLLFTLLFLFVYLAIHAFGRVMQERQPWRTEDRFRSPYNCYVTHSERVRFNQVHDPTTTITCIPPSPKTATITLEAMCRRAIELGHPRNRFFRTLGCRPVRGKTRVSSSPNPGTPNWNACAACSPVN